MSVDIIYDKYDNKVPSREFLSTVIILLRKCEMETDMSFMHWLENFEQADRELDVYDDKDLRAALSAMLKEYYPDKIPEFNAADWVDEDDEDMPTIEPMKEQETKQLEAPLDLDDEDNLPPVIRLND